MFVFGNKEDIRRARTPLEVDIPGTNRPLLAHSSIVPPVTCQVRQMIARAGGATAAVEYLEKARASNNTSKMGSWYPLNCVDTPDQPQTRVPNLAGNEGGKGSEEDGHLYGYDTDYGIGGDSWIHSTSMINVGYYVAVAPNNQSANVRNLPFNT